MKHDWKCWLDGDAEDDATDVRLVVAVAAREQAAKGEP